MAELLTLGLEDPTEQLEAENIPETKDPQIERSFGWDQLEQQILQAILAKKEYLWKIHAIPFMEENGDPKQQEINLRIWVSHCFSQLKQAEADAVSIDAFYNYKECRQIVYLLSLIGKLVPNLLTNWLVDRVAAAAKRVGLKSFTHLEEVAAARRKRLGRKGKLVNLENGQGSGKAMKERAEKNLADQIAIASKAYFPISIQKFIQPELQKDPNVQLFVKYLTLALTNELRERWYEMDGNSLASIKPKVEIFDLNLIFSLLNDPSPWLRKWYDPRTGKFIASGEFENDSLGTLPPEILKMFLEFEGVEEQNDEDLSFDEKNQKDKVLSERTGRLGHLGIYEASQNQDISKLHAKYMLANPYTRTELRSVDLAILRHREFYLIKKALKIAAYVKKIIDPREYSNDPVQITQWAKELMRIVKPESIGDEPENSAETDVDKIQDYSILVERTKEILGLVRLELHQVRMDLGDLVIIQKEEERKQKRAENFRKPTPARGLAGMKQVITKREQRIQFLKKIFKEYFFEGIENFIFYEKEDYRKNRSYPNHKKYLDLNRHAEIYFKNCRFDLFSSIRNVVPDGSAGIIHSERGDAHLTRAQFRIYIRDCLAKLEPGGYFLSDGSKESFTQLWRFEEILDAIGHDSEYKAEVVIDKNTNEPKSFFINRKDEEGFMTPAEKEYAFLPEVRFEEMNIIEARPDVVITNNIRTRLLRRASLKLKKDPVDIFGGMNNLINDQVEAILAEEYGKRVPTNLSDQDLRRITKQTLVRLRSIFQYRFGESQDA